ncbi:MAG TPA: hypothetical protein VEA61_15435 [Allosphingosinicella sp.]|nr:hypothetical protein [Allosphingosinicella sp.]
MIKTPAKAAPRPRSRSTNTIYNQAVRATLAGGDEARSRELLEGVKRLKAEYGSLDKMIAKIEAALGKAG